MFADAFSSGLAHDEPLLSNFVDRNLQEGQQKFIPKRQQESKLPIYQFSLKEINQKKLEQAGEGAISSVKEVLTSKLKDLNGQGSSTIAIDLMPSVLHRQNPEIVPNMNVSNFVASAPKQLMFNAKNVVRSTDKSAGLNEESVLSTKSDKEKKIYRTWESCGNSNHKSQVDKLTHILVHDNLKEIDNVHAECKINGQTQERIVSSVMEKEHSSNNKPSVKDIKDAQSTSPSRKMVYTELVMKEDGDGIREQMRGRTVKKKESSSPSHIPIRIPEEKIKSVSKMQGCNGTQVKRSELITNVAELNVSGVKSGKLSPAIVFQANGSEDRNSATRGDYMDASHCREDIESSPSKSPDSLEFSPLKESFSSEFFDRSPIEYLEKVAPLASIEGFKEIKTLPVYVSVVQMGKQHEKETSGVHQGGFKRLSQESRTIQETRGTFYSVRQHKQPPSPQASPEDDTLEQVSFIESSGKSPLTPETPSSEEISYDLTLKTPDSQLPVLQGKPSPIPEVSEESEEEELAKAITIKETTRFTAELDGNDRRIKENRVAYIEFPPPPPINALDAETSEMTMKEHYPSDDELEMIELNLQEEHDKHFLAEPLIRVQPPSPVPPGIDESDSSSDESIFQTIPLKKYTFKLKEDDKVDTVRYKTKGQPENIGSSQDVLQPVENTDDFVLDNDPVANGNNDQSVTECSIATTAEFSHDTDATEIDSLDGYDLQDEDDGLTETDSKSLNQAVEPKKDVWVTEGILKQGDRSYSQGKLAVIEEEGKVGAEEEQPLQSKAQTSETKGEGQTDGKPGPASYTLEGRHPDRTGFNDSYFSYKLEEEFATQFKTVATKGLDFDPWSNGRGDDEIFEARLREDEQKAFGLAVEDRSQATTPDTTPARTPTDESTPSSEPNPFPFHEGKMFEMTRSGAIDMSKRDFVEERLQFFQIGEHTSEGKSGEKGERVQNTLVVTTLSQPGDRATEAPVEIPEVEQEKVQVVGDCLEMVSSSTSMDKSSSAVIAAKGDPKLRTPIKMGISASTMTMKKDVGAAEMVEIKSDAVILGYQVSETTILEITTDKTGTVSQKCSIQNDKPDLSIVNSNDNLDPPITQTDCSQGRDITQAEPAAKTTDEDPGTLACSVTEIKADKQKKQNKTEKVKIPKSRLPVKIASTRTSICQNKDQKPENSKVKQSRKIDFTEKAEPHKCLEPKSRIPVKNIDKSNVAPTAKCQSILTPGQKEVGKSTQFYSRLPVKVRSNTATTKTGKDQLSEARKHTIEYFKGISGETLKIVDRLADEEKKVQSEMSDDEDSTSRNASLSEAGQACQPSITSRSPRDMRPEAAPLKTKVEKVDSETRNSKRTGGEESSQVSGPHVAHIVEIKPSPQSPCERTDIRTAIVADHLGLSWTELAREMNFSVDDINQIRVENPNSLTTQSFILLKKWVYRDGKNATTDALSTVLKKINRMDIVTLLEGPIFDYGNVSGTRSFVDDSCVFMDQSEGHPNIQTEILTPTSLRYVPPTPLRCDDYFSDFYGVESTPRIPHNLNDEIKSRLPIIDPEDMSLEDSKADEDEMVSADHRQVSEATMGTSNEPKLHQFTEISKVFDSDTQLSNKAQQEEYNLPLEGGKITKQKISANQPEEGTEELTEERVKTCHKEIPLGEGTQGSEYEELTEEKLQALQSQNFEREFFTVPGWHSEASSVDVEPPTPKSYTLSTECLDRPDVNVQEQQSKDEFVESVVSHQKGQADGKMSKLEENGEHDIHSVECQSSEAKVQEPAEGLSVGVHDRKTLNGKAPKCSVLITEQTEPRTDLQKEFGGTTQPVIESVTALFGSEKKMSWTTSEDRGPSSREEERQGQELGESEPSSDEEEIVTTKVIRRRVILKAEEAKNIPGETVVEEQYVDEDGNHVTRKVTRKVVRRIVKSKDNEPGEIITEAEGQDDEEYSEYFECADTEQEQVEGYKVIKVKKETIRHADKKTH
ncbi:ankyrin-3 isoform X8 [Callorhinchus milii]|uniref:ankyrin-3 isoform X8 n=1 Tax=Callorhinchus milii TaxID=7868 RepID=UPI001C3F9C4E|nr:ankyrin-3 isoform X8 [Callorhinchus milii]